MKKKDEFELRLEENNLLKDVRLKLRFSCDQSKLEVEKCEICSHETCPTCHECHNMDCDTFCRPENKCFDLLFPKKSQPLASEGWERSCPHFIKKRLGGIIIVV